MTSASENISQQRIDSNWRVSLPEDLMKEKGWRIGDQIDLFYLEGDLILLLPTEKRRRMQMGGDFGV